MRCPEALTKYLGKSKNTLNFCSKGLRVPPQVRNQQLGTGTGTLPVTSRLHVGPTSHCHPRRVRGLPLSPKATAELYPWACSCSSPPWGAAGSLALPPGGVLSLGCRDTLRAGLRESPFSEVGAPYVTLHPTLEGTSQKGFSGI